MDHAGCATRAPPVDDVSPRAAGWLAILGGILLAVLGGFLIATPPWSIPGAVVLVGSTILLSVGVVWLQRRSWTEPWPPYTAPSLRKRVRRFRALLILNSVLVVAVIADAVYAVASQDWWKLVPAGFFLILAAGNLTLSWFTWRFLRETQENESAPTPEP